MRIGIVCTGSQPVPPVNYGGTQMVNWETAEALIDNGDEVTLFAPGESSTNAKLVEIDSGWGVKNEYINFIKYIQPFIAKDKIDIVLDTTAYGWVGRMFKNFPYVARMGGDPEKKYCRNFARNIVFPSHRHLKFHSQNDCECGIARGDREGVVIHKPVCYRYTSEKLSAIPLSSGGKGYFLYIGQIAFHKGTHLAIEFCKKVGATLVILGPKDLSDYFYVAIKPELSDKIIYGGAVDNFKKWNLMAEADAVVFTSTCEEGDPNVPKEALLVGTPVIALDGTVSEIVTDMVTGVICKNVDEMVDRYREVYDIDHSFCRLHVLNNFGIEQYVDNTRKILIKAIKGDVWM